VGHGACGGEEMHISFWLGDFKERGNMEYIGIHRRIL
jgi:hypothetical protein